MIKLLIADDHPLFSAGIEIILINAGMEVVGKIHTDDEVVSKYFQLLPDLLICSIRIGQHSHGLNIVGSILDREPTAKIIFISEVDEENLIRQSYMAGTKAFLPKSVEGSQLVAAIQNVYDGDIYITPEIAIRLTKQTFSQQNKRVDLETVLTERELTVFKLLADGISEKEIAEKLHLSQKTISNDKTSIRDKIGGLKNKADYTKLAIKSKLISLD